MENKKRNFNDVLNIKGTVVIKRNPTWGFTTRCSKMIITYNDGTEDVCYQEGNKRSSTCRGCGYDKIEMAIHSTLTKFVDYTTIPTTGNFHKDCDFDISNSSAFYREHYFYFSNLKADIPTINVL